MKFQYAFQKIVDLKSNEKTQAEWMLSSAIGRLQAEEKSLGELMDNRERMANELQEAAEQKVPVSKIREFQMYVEHLEQCIEKKHTDVQHANVNVEMKKDQLSHKVLDEKVWLKAKDKAKDTFQQSMLLREQNELDEMATVRFAIKAR
ncbi:flagellar export protein FliJ [Paenibacillus dokdonensis]|uniref:Flagellar FliJ protein n=1 Tax=Paenibacillus dokdonensis TaxID=2567944 RepID=A0ABU6GL96_9BACL|nr:flagellar export protein FliJ [Paenibacillus dokdonensis]MEC0240531.1 flagellar export protein FliJ [Paenibacillus dokdonensis]